MYLSKPVQEATGFVVGHSPKTMVTKSSHIPMPLCLPRIRAKGAIAADSRSIIAAENDNGIKTRRVRPNGSHSTAWFRGRERSFKGGPDAGKVGLTWESPPRHHAELNSFRRVCVY